MLVPLDTAARYTLSAYLSQQNYGLAPTHRSRWLDCICLLCEFTRLFHRLFRHAIPLMRLVTATALLGHAVLLMRCSHRGAETAMAHHLQPTRHDAPKQRQPLHPVLINALLHVRGGRCRIEITHYSQHGLSLDRATGVELDERVTVELGSGRRLPMRVAWVKGTTAGVRFLGPIVSERAVMRWLDEAVKMQKHRRSL
jgi:hypothetical protein